MALAIGIGVPLAGNVLGGGGGSDPSGGADNLLLETLDNLLLESDPTEDVLLIE